MADKQIKAPDQKGRFGPYGGRYVPETVIYALTELEHEFRRIKRDSAFKKELSGYLRDYVGRPSPLYFAERLTEHARGCRIWFKREDLNHTGAHKINNVVGQIMLARYMGKRELSPRPAPVNMVWLRPLFAPGSDWSASYTWALKTSSARNRMSTKCACSARR